jgi:hypothetical protein
MLKLLVLHYLRNIFFKTETLFKISVISHLCLSDNWRNNEF